MCKDTEVASDTDDGEEGGGTSGKDSAAVSAIAVLMSLPPHLRRQAYESHLKRFIPLTS